MKTLVSVLLALAWLCNGQSTANPKEMTMGQLNGRAWQRFTDRDQNYFVVGFYQYSECCVKDKKDQYIPASATVAETAKGVSRIYDDPENLKIPIGWAIYIFAKKDRGEAPDAIARYLAAARRVANGESLEDFFK